MEADFFVLIFGLPLPLSFGGEGGVLGGEGKGRVCFCESLSTGIVTMQPADVPTKILFPSIARALIEVGVVKVASVAAPLDGETAVTVGDNEIVIQGTTQTTVI